MCATPSLANGIYEISAPMDDIMGGEDEAGLVEVSGRGRRHESMIHRVPERRMHLWEPSTC